MAKPTPTWKQVEREVAKKVGGVRTNADRGLAVEDITHPVFSFEVKHGGQIPRWILKVYMQAYVNAPAGKVPVAVLHPQGWVLDRSLVVMSLGDFHDLLANQKPLAQEAGEGE